MTLYFIIYSIFSLLTFIIMIKIITALSIKKRGMIHYKRSEKEQTKEELRRIQEEKDAYKEIVIEAKTEEYKANNWWRKILGN